MKLGGNQPLGHNALLYSISGMGSFICPVTQTRLDIYRPTKAFEHPVIDHWLRWPIKDINFILVFIVFLSLSTAGEMFSPRNYTFHHGKKSFLRGENFIPRNYTFHRGKKSFLRGENFIARNYTFLHGVKLYSAELYFSPRNYTFLRGIILIWSLDMDARNPSCPYLKLPDIKGKEREAHPYRGSRSRDFSPRWKV